MAKKTVTRKTPAKSRANKTATKRTTTANAVPEEAVISSPSSEERIAKLTELWQSRPGLQLSHEGVQLFCSSSCIELFLAGLKVPIHASLLNGTFDQQWFEARQWPRQCSPRPAPSQRVRSAEQRIESRNCSHVATRADETRHLKSRFKSSV